MNTKVLIFLLDPSNTELNIDEQIKLLEDEIFAYEKKLRQLPVLKVINKSDLSNKPNGMINISALEGLGIDKLLEKIDELNISSLKALNKSYLRTDLNKNEFTIENTTQNYWEVFGHEVDRITNLIGNEIDVFNEISYRFENSDISAELKLLGVNNGSTIKLGKFEFIYE
jgi:GTPase involved in cell partitioning and DNA repair